MSRIAFSRDPKPKVHRVGLYIRVSTEEQLKPEGSIKSQEQRLRQNIELKNQGEAFGEIAGVFIDRARSGKDTNRPELQRLLTAIRRQEITLVVVTELSRLSRSIKDFAEIWEMMRKHGCEFQSLREQFDTTTAAGEMVLYTIANISQFERKQCSERIVANFQARAERGLFNGGAVPFGYELDPDQKGSLKIHAEDGALVREAFGAFLQEGSLSRTARSLNERGLRMRRRRQGGGDRARLGHFTVENLHAILTNPAYAGLRVYSVKGERHVTRACWEPIIDEVLLKKVDAMLKKNRYRLKTPNKTRYPYLLSGLCFCGTCRDTMNGKSAHGNGGKIPYYEHGWATKRQGTLNRAVFACQPHRVQARILEPAVWDEVVKLLSNPAMAAALMGEAQKLHARQGGQAETDKVRGRLQGVSEQIEALAEHLAQIPKGVSPVPIFAQMQRLEGLRQQTQSELDEVARSGGAMEMPASLTEYEAYLGLVRGLLNDAAAPELRAKIVRKLVHRVEVLPEAFRVHYYMGKSVVVPMDGGEAQKHESPELVAPGFSIFSNRGSNRLTNGWFDMNPAIPMT